MNPDTPNAETPIKNTIEALLFASRQPLSLRRIRSLMEDTDAEQIRAAIEELQADYSERAVQLVEVASGYRFQVVPGHTQAVQSMYEERPQRYSRAVMETLALIAYRQPITRSEIEEIRGISASSRVIATLLERNWIRIVGYADSIGRPANYGTTRAFLDYFNLQRLEDLPPLGEVRELSEMNAEQQDKRFGESLNEAIALDNQRKLEEEAQAQAEQLAAVGSGEGADDAGTEAGDGAADGVSDGVAENGTVVIEDIADADEDEEDPGLPN